MNISKYVTLKEAIKSNVAESKGISNIPDGKHIEAMKHVASHVFDPLREFVGGALFVTSFYRSPELNKAIGGSPTSQHCKGEAIDIDCDRFNNGTNAEIFKFVIDNLQFDQVIAEFPSKEGAPSWVHVSLKKDKNRREVLVALHQKGKTVYKPFNGSLKPEDY